MLSCSKSQGIINLDDNRLYNARTSTNDCLALYISDMLNMNRDEELFKLIHEEHELMSSDGNYRVLRNLLQEMSICSLEHC